MTEAEPLLMYLLSTDNVQAVLARLDLDAQQRRVAGLRALVEHLLATSGQIMITKDAGVFVAAHANQRVREPRVPALAPRTQQLTVPPLPTRGRRQNPEGWREAKENAEILRLRGE